MDLRRRSPLASIPSPRAVARERKALLEAAEITGKLVATRERLIELEDAAKAILECYQRNEIIAVSAVSRSAMADLAACLHQKPRE